MVPLSSGGRTDLQPYRHPGSPLSTPLTLPKQPYHRTQTVFKLLHHDLVCLHPCVWMLSGLPSKRLALLKTLLPLQQNIDDCPVEQSMTIIYHSFPDGVPRKVFVPSSASVTVIWDCLLSHFNSGLQITTFRDYRSTSSAVHHRFDDDSTLFHNTAIPLLTKRIVLRGATY